MDINVHDEDSALVLAVAQLHDAARLLFNIALPAKDADALTVACGALAGSTLWLGERGIDT